MANLKFTEIPRNSPWLMILICFPRVTILGWYRELITANLTPAGALIPSLFRLVLAQFSLPLVIMADKESRIFEEVIDQKLNSIANIPAAISDLIFGDELISQPWCLISCNIITSTQASSLRPVRRRSWPHSPACVRRRWWWPSSPPVWPVWRSCVSSSSGVTHW